MIQMCSQQTALQRRTFGADLRRPEQGYRHTKTNGFFCGPDRPQITADVGTSLLGTVYLNLNLRYRQMSTLRELAYNYARVLHSTSTISHSNGILGIVQSIRYRLSPSLRDTTANTLVCPSLGVLNPHYPSC